MVGDTPAQVERAVPTRINGVPAVLLEMRVAVRDGSIPLSIAAYDGGGGEAYHFIIVSPPGNSQAVAVTALFQSFRRLTPQEASTLRPRVIRTVRTTAGDTPDTLVRRMADPAPRALFELLNDRNDVGVGTLVKIVTYRDAR